jgi:hypothetical protein
MSFDDAPVKIVDVRDPLKVFVAGIDALAGIIYRWFHACTLTF